MENITVIQCQVVGAIALFVVFWNVYGIVRKSKIWLPVKGKLIGYEIHIHEQYNNHSLSIEELELYHGQYEYEDGNGNKYIHVSQNGFGGKYPEIGVVRILYFNKSNTRESRESYKSGNELNYLGVVFGGIILITAIYLYSSL